MARQLSIQKLDTLLDDNGNPLQDEQLLDDNGIPISSTQSSVSSLEAPRQTTKPIEIDRAGLVDSPLNEPKLANLATSDPNTKNIESPDNTEHSKSLWEHLTTRPQFIKDITDSLANTIDSPSLDRSPLMARIKGFGAGALEGASEFFNPLDVGTALATMGAGSAAKAGLSGLAKILNYGAKGASALVAGHGIGNIVSPDSTWGERGQGLAEITGGIMGMKSNLPKIASKIDAPPVESSVMEEAIAKPIKRKIIINRDGTFTDKDTGEILDKTGKPVPVESEPNIMDLYPGDGASRIIREGEDLLKNTKPDKPPTKYHPAPEWPKGTKLDRLNELRDKARDGSLSGDELAEARILFKQLRDNDIKPTKPDIDRNSKFFVKNRAPILPKDLQGAKPRFNMGNISYEPKFESDLDKALFIISQKTPSKRDADYLKFVMEHTGLDEIQSRNIANEVRTKLKAALKGQDAGEIDIPALHKPTEAVTSLLTKPPVPPIKPPNKPPIIEGLNEDPLAPLGREHLGPDVDKIKNNKLMEAFNFPRAMQATLDLSAPLRQGLPLIHKKEFWKSLGPMFQSWTSEEGFQASQKALGERPLFKKLPTEVGKELKSIADKAGLSLNDLTNLSSREERIASTWAERIPGVRASNRAYTAFLNNLRADTYESLVKSSKAIGIDASINEPLLKSLADFVNTATGRGNLGKLESSANALNATFFAPRLIASRIQLPLKLVSKNPIVRKEALKSLLAVAGVGNLLGQMVKLSGMGEVNSNKTSADYGKIKIGNTRIDPFAGFQQYEVLLSKMIEGKTTSSTTGNTYNLGEKFGRDTRLDVMGRFAENKLHPVLSFVTSMLRGKDFKGQKFNIPEEVVKRMTPIVIQDLKELLTENPDLLPGFNLENYQEFHPENAPAIIPSYFGMGMQRYGGPKQ